MELHTIRKGNKEKSLGSFDEEDLRELKRLEEQTRQEASSIPPQKEVQETSPLDELKDWQENKREFVEDIQFSRGTRKSINCAHLTDDGYCTFWRTSIEPDYTRFESRIFNVEYRKMTSDPETFIIKATPSYCKLCSVYKPREKNLIPAERLTS